MGMFTGVVREGMMDEQTQFPPRTSDVNRSSSIAKLAEALSQTQGEVEGAKKDTENPFFRSKYADLASVWDACRAPLSKHGLAVVQMPQTRFLGKPEPYTWTTKQGEERHGIRVPSEISVVTSLIHSSGEFISSEFSCLLDSADPQAVGSAITYLRRYALQSIVGIAPEDDDAEGAQGRGKSATATAGVDEKLAADLWTAALELAGGEEDDAKALLTKLSSFTGKDGKAMSFSDPFKVKSTKWLNGVLHKVRDDLARLEVEGHDEKVPF
jgi:hypothetical protein